jgi:hypothetical protein
MLDKDARYLKVYRAKLGFQNQLAAKKFFSARDIVQKIDYTYLNRFNRRLTEILYKLNHVSSNLMNEDQLKIFSEKNISAVFHALRDDGFFEKLYSQYKKPHLTYFSWMRQYVVSKFLFRSFGLEAGPVDIIIEDEADISVDAFKDMLFSKFEICLDDALINIFLNSTFDGKNIIAESLIKAGAEASIENHRPSWVINFDVFNGAAVFQRLDIINPSSRHWLDKSSRDGGRLFRIPSKAFTWKYTDPVPSSRKMLRFFTS